MIGLFKLLQQIGEGRCGTGADGGAGRKLLQLKLTAFEDFNREILHIQHRPARRCFYFTTAFMGPEIKLAINSAKRALGLLWVILLSFRYRPATASEIATLRDLCCRLESGVPRCQEYNEAVRHVLAEVREICDADVSVPARAEVERLAKEIDRLNLLLVEYLPMGTESVVAR